MVNYRQVERNFFEVTQNIRAIVFLPLLKILHALKITANMITIFRGIIFIPAVMFPLFIYNNVKLAVILYFLVFWLLDMIDGSLARYSRTESDRGKFIDTVVDMLGHSFFCMGLAYSGVASPFIMFYQVIINAAVYLVAILYKNEGQPTDWIIRPEANLTYLKYIPYTFVVLYVWKNIDFINPVFSLINSLSTILFVYYFVQFIRKPKNLNT